MKTEKNFLTEQTEANKKKINASMAKDRNAKIEVTDPWADDVMDKNDHLLDDEPKGKATLDESKAKYGKKKSGY